MQIIRTTEEFVRRLRAYFSSGVQLIQVAADGQLAEACKAIHAAAKEWNPNLDPPTIVWDPVNGFGGKHKNLVEAVNLCSSAELDLGGPSVRVFISPQGEIARNYAAVHALAWGASTEAFARQDHGAPVVLVTADSRVHPELAPYVKLLPFPLPNLQVMRTIVEDLDLAYALSAGANNPDIVWHAADKDLSNKLANSLLGLPGLAARDALTLSFRLSRREHSSDSVFGGPADRGFSSEMVQYIEEEKALTFKASEVLEYIPQIRLNASALGGYDHLENWLRRRRAAFTESARAARLDTPKGIILGGIPGTGKSRCMRVIAQTLGLPLVIMRVDAVYDSLVGESEKRIRQALQQVSSLNGCVLAIDEADKLFGQSSQSHEVKSNILSVVLNWLADKQDPSFVVMALNRVGGLPPELLRKGRFDELFFVDVPSAEERIGIFKIHLESRGTSATIYDPNDWAKLAASSRDFVGAEIEAAVVDAKYEAYAERSSGDPTMDELLSAVKAVKPMSQTDSENLKEIRDTLVPRAKPVSSAKVASTGRGLDPLLN